MRDLPEHTTRKSQAPEAGWASIIGFWLLYFLVNTVRAFAAVHPRQFEMIGRRAVVIVLMIGVTWIFHLILTRLAGSIRRSIAAAAAIALPAALAYSTLNAFVFALPSPLHAWTVPSVSAQACSSKAMKPSVASTASSTMSLGHLSCDDGGPITQQIIGNTADGYFLFIAWSTLYLALQYAGEVQALERRAAELRAAAQSAELRALRYQVNPHFLFNTLNSLSSLVMTGRADRAEKMIANLATFFRTSLAGDPTQDVTLAEEFALQQLYLAIEAVRFPERLIVDIAAPAELASARVPGMILQPLVENAVKHGVSTTSRPVTIMVRAEAANTVLRLSVEDDGARAPAQPPGGTGLGLRNVCDRLSARYGEATRCSWTHTSKGGFRVEVLLPLVLDVG